MENKIEIHEFSTGIEVKGTPKAWESGGFTGEYMNRTIDKIPQAVLDSIANREFALAEGVVRAEPAIVGRVVRRGKESWSVVAVVTRGRDDRGRGVSLYRYFLCHGDTGIETILRWRMMRQPSLVFNPFEKRVIGQPYQVNPISEKVSLDNFQDLLDHSPPIIVPATKRCMPLILNEITRILRPSGDCSWAYKVAMLERPEYFEVIYPADTKAETVIKEVLERRQSSSVLISEESGIKTAIKAVMSGRVKRGHIQTLENALGNSEFDDNYWESILNKEGADQAFKENFYGDRYVRLLTLKAMLVPSFLPKFLAWLADSKKSEIHYPTSLKLQELMLQEAPKFTKNFTRLSESIKRGICYTIDDLLDEPKILKQSQLLLTSKFSLWKKVYPLLSNDLEIVINKVKQRQNLHSLKKEYPHWSSLLDKIHKFWDRQILHDHNDKNLTKYYKNLTKLFEKVKTKELAAIFYQIGEGSVPKSLFFEVSGNTCSRKNTALTAPVWGIKINRRKEIGDYVRGVYCFLFKTIYIGGIRMPRFIALMILLVVFTGGFTLGSFSPQLNLEISGSTGKAQNNDQKNGNNQQSTADPKNDNDKTEGDKEKTQKNLLSQKNKGNYKDTDDAIESITKELTPEIKENVNVVLSKTGIPSGLYLDINNINNKGIVIYCINTIIKLSELKTFKYSKIIENDTNWKKFSDAIKEYQKSKGAKGKSADGVISPQGNTQKWLKTDIRKECLKHENPQSSAPEGAGT